MNCGHDEAPQPDECSECEAWMEEQEACWLAYFGKGQIREAVDRDREERENHGRLLTDEERMDEARRLK